MSILPNLISKCIVAQASARWHRSVRVSIAEMSRLAFARLPDSICLGAFGSYLRCRAIPLLRLIQSIEIVGFKPITSYLYKQLDG